MLFVERPQTKINGQVYNLTQEQLKDVKYVAEIKNIPWEILAKQPAQAMKMVKEILGDDEDERR